MAIGEVYRLTVEWGTADNAPTAVNQFYFQQAGVIFQPTPEEDLVKAFRTLAEVHYASWVTSALAIRKYAVAQSPEFQTSYELTGLSVGGQLSGDPMPPFVAALIDYRTGLFTRRGRGRVYLPPANEANNTGGKPSTGYQAGVGDFIVDMLTDMKTGDGATYGPWTWVMWSRADQTYRTILNAFVPGLWSTQRDRKRLY